MIKVARDLGTRIYPVFPTWRRGSLTRRTTVLSGGNDVISSSHVMSYKGDDSPMQYIFPLDEGVLGLKFLFWFSQPIFNALYRSQASSETPVTNTNPIVSMTDPAHSQVNLCIHYRILLSPIGLPPHQALQSPPDPTLQTELMLPPATTRSDRGSGLFYKDRGSTPIQGNYYLPAHPWTHAVFGQFYIPGSGAISDSSEPDTLCVMRGKIALTRVTVRDGGTPQRVYYVYSPGVYVVETAINTAGFRTGIIEFAVGSQDGQSRMIFGSEGYSNSIAPYDALPMYRNGTALPERGVALFVRGIALALEI